MNTRSVIDVALVNNEIDLARFRVDYLSGLIQRHLFVEANIDHGGVERPYSLVDFWGHGVPEEVIILRFDVPSRVRAHGSRWAVEEYSRQWAMAKAMSLFPNSIILISDIDEVPSRAQVVQLPSVVEPSGKATLPMVTSYRRANWLADGGRPRWRKAKAFTAESFDPALRFRRAPLVTAQPGQHFRYLGFSSERAVLKHQSFAHREFDVPRELQAEAWRLADSYLLANVPSIGHRGAGLLIASGRKSLSDPARFLVHSRPDLFEARDSIAPVRERLVASLVVSRLFAARNGKDTRRWPTTSLTQFMVALLAQLGSFIGLRVLFRVIRRLVQGSPSRPGGRTLVDAMRGVNLFGDWKVSSTELRAFQVAVGHVQSKPQPNIERQNNVQFRQRAHFDHIESD